MALSVTALTGSSDTANAFTYNTASVSTTTGRLVVVVAAVSGSGAQPTPDLSGPGTLSLVDQVSNNQARAITMAVYEVVAGGTGSFTISHPSLSNYTSAIWSIFEIDGHDTTTPVVQTDSENGGTVTGATITLPSAVTSGNGVFGAFHLNDSVAITPGDGGIEIHDLPESSPTSAVGTQYNLSPSIDGISATWSTSTYRAVVMEIAVASGGGTTVEGQAASAFGGTFTASGVPTTPGSTQASFGFTSTAQGVPRTPGTASAAFGGTFTASGIDRALGAAVSAFGGTFTASGVVDGGTVVEGLAQSDFGGTFTATGTGKTIILGTATSSFGGTLTAAGVDRALGSVVASFGATLTANGLRVVFGQGASAFGFEAQTSGMVIRTITGTASSSFGFSSQGTGIAAEPLIAWTPPTYEVQIFSRERVLNLHRLTTANTIVRVNGVFQSFRTPRSELLEGLTHGEDYFRGGYVYNLPQSLVTELLNAGFPSG